MDGDQMIEERYISLANKIGDSLYRDEYLSQKPTDDIDTTDSELNQQEGSDEEKAVSASNNDVETDQAAVNNGSNDVNIQNVTSGTTLGEGQETTITPSSDSNSNPSGGVLTARQRWLQGDSPGAVDTRRRIAEGNAKIAEKKRLAAIEELKEQ